MVDSKESISTGYPNIISYLSTKKLLNKWKIAYAKLK